jgi:hypothetical protein
MSEYCDYYFDQDSRKVAGIQMADLCAHSLSIMLLEQLGLINKNVRARGYDPNIEINIGFELWASLRYHFFTQDKINFDVSQIEGFALDTESYALCIAPSCSAILTKAAKERFGTMYIGCIH